MPRRVYYRTPAGTDEGGVAKALAGSLCPPDADVRLDPATGIVAITTDGPWRGEEAMTVDLAARAEALRPHADAIAILENGRGSKAALAKAVAARDDAERAWDAAPVMVGSGKVVETGLGVVGWELLAVEQLDGDEEPPVDDLVRAKVAHAEVAPIALDAARVEATIPIP